MPQSKDEQLVVVSQVSLSLSLSHAHTHMYVQTMYLQCYGECLVVTHVTHTCGSGFTGKLLCWYLIFYIFFVKFVKVLVADINIGYEDIVNTQVMAV